MNVAQILESKGNSVYTIAADAKIADLIDMLARHKIGAAVVSDASLKVEGIVSERDIIRHLAAKCAEIMQHTVADCMTRKVITVARADTLDRVLEIMSEGRFRHVPVIENGKLAGLVSIGDVVQRKIEQAEHDVEDLKRYIAS